MTLDPQTLLAVNIANLAALALLLSVIMGRDLSSAALKGSGRENAKEWTVSTVREILEGALRDLGLSTKLLAELPVDDLVDLMRAVVPNTACGWPETT